MKDYSELFLGLILAGVVLITLGFMLLTTSGALGSRDLRMPTAVAERSN